jgi:hypothetical protein
LGADLMLFDWIAPEMITVDHGHLQTGLGLIAEREA